MTAVMETVRTERLALLDLLATLDEAQWATPSLCAGWTVQDVAAHLAWASALSPAGMVAGLARARFSPNRFAFDSARSWATRGVPAILAQLRRNAERGAKPLGMPATAALVDAVVHSLDVRRPLGRPRPLSADAFEPAADFCVRPPWPAATLLGGGPAARIEGVRLVADGTGWSHGAGPEVGATPEVVLLLLTGRPVAREELHGLGAPTVRARL